MKVKELISVLQKLEGDSNLFFNAKDVYFDELEVHKVGNLSAEDSYDNIKLGYELELK